jgi:hypothetical protein
MSKYTIDQAKEAITSSVSFREVLRKLGLAEAGGNYKTIKALVKEYQVPTEHWTGKGHLKGKTHTWSPKQKFEDILVENSTYTSTHKLKNRLLKEGLFERKCYECGLTEWRGHPIPIELEHKNGINTDHRLENLTLLCPNCHAQTSTYRGKNKRK